MENLLITLIYYAIAVTLFYLVRQQQDRRFQRACIAISLILICDGTTHLLEVWPLTTYQTQVLNGINLIKLIAGAYTTMVFIIFSLKKLNLPSPQDFQKFQKRLSEYNNQFEKQNQTIDDLENLTDFLQSSPTETDLEANLVQFLRPLFPNVWGRVFLVTNAENDLEIIDGWGDWSLEEPPISPNQCWALQQSQYQCWQLTPETFDERQLNQSCLCCQNPEHYRQPSTLLCLPMIAREQILGILQLRFIHPEKLTPSTLKLAKTVARQIALGLMNLRNYETLQYQSCHDPLTGLFNRRYLEVSLERELYRVARANDPLGVIMLDIDYFKSFNDTYGHLAGDKVLQTIGTFLQENVRQSDIVCRYGGEELTLILPSASNEDIRIRAEQIRQGIKSLQISWDSQNLPRITVSMGIACYPQNGTTLTQLLQMADQALYQAKHQGRDCIVFA